MKAINWIFFIYAFLFSVNAFATVAVAAFIRVDWTSLNGTEKFVLACAMAGNWTSLMLAFVNKVGVRIEQGKPLIETGDSTPPFKPEPSKP